MIDAAPRFAPDGIHRFALRVYYEDTDTGGIVYYANYLKFAERARTEVLRDLGITQRILMEEDGLAFAVRRCEVDYFAPARLDDALVVRTALRTLGAASLDLDQAIYRIGDGASEPEQELARLMVRLAVINRGGRPTRLPSNIADLLRSVATVATPLHPPATANKKRA
jgi:acyl-CoA thioester hydrolase